MKRVRETVEMIVQLPVHVFDAAQSSNGTTPSALLAGMRESFQQRQLGIVDGTDRGQGVVNLFITDIKEADWVRAFELALKVVTDCGLSDESIIAKSVSWESADDARIDYTVYWPEQYDREFSIW